MNATTVLYPLSSAKSLVEYTEALNESFTEVQLHASEQVRPSAGRHYDAALQAMRANSGTSPEFERLEEMRKNFWRAVRREMEGVPPGASTVRIVE